MYSNFDYGDPVNNFYQKKYDYYSALGVGVRINFLEVLDFNLQAGYGFGYSSSFSNLSIGANFSQYNTTLDVGAGLYFHF